jgi:16S rRNA (cytosine967-C5)-methyltransferase
MPVNEIPGFDAGCVSVQDPASQLAARFLSPTPGERVLDACAAPGGKTTHLLELVDGALDLTALDIDSDRLSRVGENLQRLGFVATTVHGDAARPSDWWDGRLFDAILVDAPCSATGIIRRHPDIKFLRRESDIPALAQRQLHLLEQLWPLLRAGGRLLYSTCSILSEENTAVVTAFLARHPDASLAAPATDLLPPWVRQQNAGGWQVLPGSADTDGFYYALMTRNAAAPGAFR